MYIISFLGIISAIIGYYISWNNLMILTNKSYIFDKCDPLNIVANKIILPNYSTDYNKSAHQFSSNSGGSHKYSNSPIAFCNSEQEVINVVNFARECDYKLSIRSGGHSYTGNSKCSSERCIQVDLSKINHIKLSYSKSNIIDAGLSTHQTVDAGLSTHQTVDAGLSTHQTVDAGLSTHQTVDAGPGILLRKVINFLLWNKMTFPHGLCKNVALGGHLQSSAFGFLQYEQGSGLDYVESFRLVKSDGTVEEVTNKTNLELYKAVLGSAPGSYGIITNYQIKAIPDKVYPESRIIVKTFKYNKQTLKKMFDIYQLIINYRQTYLKKFMTNIEYGNLFKDIDVLPDIPLIGSYSDYFNTFSDDYIIQFILLWTDPLSIDDILSNYLKDLDNLKPLYFRSFDLKLPLSIATSLTYTFDIPNKYFYHEYSIQSDYKWSDIFTNKLIDEIDDRYKSNIKFIIQYFITDNNSQFYKNKDLNSLSWRDQVSYWKEWSFSTNKNDSNKMANRIRYFYEENEKYWIYSDNIIKQNWMDLTTIYSNSADIHNLTIAKRYFPNETYYNSLRLLKHKIDPIHMFSNPSTILPINLNHTE
jgi:hypothetical protein